jgi:hypothetical protein
LSALDRRLFAHPAEIPRLDRPGIPAGSRSYPLIHAKGRPADLAGGRLSRDPGAAFVQVFFSSQATGRTESRNGSRILVVVTSIDLGNYRFLPPAAAPAAIPSVKRGGPCLSFTKRSSRADARLTRLERSEHPRSPATCATKRAGGAPPPLGRLPLRPQASAGLDCSRGVSRWVRRLNAMAAPASRQMLASAVHRRRRRGCCFLVARAKKMAPRRLLSSGR